MADTKHLYSGDFPKLPISLLETAMQVGSFMNQFDGPVDPWYFEWVEFKEAVNSYRGDDLKYDGFSNGRFNQDGGTIKAMVAKIADFIRVALAFHLPGEDFYDLVESIEEFTNSKVAQENNWADFKNTGTHPHLVYRGASFEFSNPDWPDYFYSLVMTVRLSEPVGDISAEVDAMRLLVKKGFKAPKEQD
ncbi:delta-endotoxin CytB [Marasmius fiardii PR-910]|nr:delta-endotoxin CytB [Marasmius fiardii PR-910]